MYRAYINLGAHSLGRSREFGGPRLIYKKIWEPEAIVSLGLAQDWPCLET